MFAASLHVGKDTQSLGRSLCAGDVGSMKTATEGLSILGRLREARRYASFDAADLVALATVVYDSIGRVERVGAALRLALHFRDVCVVVGCETAGVLARLVSCLSTRSFNVIELHHVASGSTCHRVSLGPSLVDVVDGHGVANKLRRSRGANFHLRQVVRGIQRVVALSLRLELDNLWSGALNVASLQVRLVLVEPNVEGARA